MDTKLDFTVSTLGECTIPSPIRLSAIQGERVANYVRDDEFVRYETDAKAGPQPRLDAGQLLQKAGPREKIYFGPSHVHAGIVTCGGLCPGLNDVIRSIVRCLWYRYGVRRITGIRYGYKGLLPDYNIDVKDLGPDVVDDIHKMGGTILGSSRGGGERTGEIVDAIERLNLNMIFTIGGDGTQKGALAIAREIEKRKLKIAIVGIPKTIDNDLLFVDKSFGFETAVSKAVEAVSGAHAEAHSSLNGIVLVKLMGRESGFIAVHTVLAAHEANFVLIPEVPFDLDGKAGLLAAIEDRIARRHHAVIVVAEGAGQEILAAASAASEAATAIAATDASGNLKLADIGLFLKDRIQDHFKKKGLEINLKYIDPSYLVRSAPACPTDSVYCERLGKNAAHAAMAGKTRVLMGMVNGEFVHLPIAVATSSRSHVDPEGALWRDAVDATQQPFTLKSLE